MAGGYGERQIKLLQPYMGIQKHQLSPYTMSPLWGEGGGVGGSLEMWIRDISNPMATIYNQIR